MKSLYIIFLVVFLFQIVSSDECPCSNTCPTTPTDQFVDASTVIPNLQLDLRYAGFHNFVGQPIDGYECARCILTRTSAMALASVQEQLLAMNLSLKVYDCYRPQRAVNEFYSWSLDPNATLMKREFYPFLPKDQLFPLGYIAECSSHSRGSTVDVTIVPFPPPPEEQYVPGITKLEPCMAPEGIRFGDNSLDFGTGFDCFSNVSHTQYPYLLPEIEHRRELFVQLMLKSGFINLSTEWWHFTWANEPYPTIYFNFPICNVN